MRRRLAHARTVVLATALGALAGVLIGAEHPDQRPPVMGLAAGVGLLTGVFVVLIPKPPAEAPQTFPREPGEDRPGNETAPANETGPEQDPKSLAP